MVVLKVSIHNKENARELLVDIFLEEGKVSRVEKAEVYAEWRFQGEAIEINKNKNNTILLYILVEIRHCSKQFTHVYINAFNPHNIL